MVSKLSRPPIAASLERRLLQAAVIVAGCVPVSAGAAGVWLGAAMTGDRSVGGALDSHYRYLSGLLLGVGLIFWVLAPRIERATAEVRALTVVVVIGGLGRLLGLALSPHPPGLMAWALVMELGVTPVLCLWQARVARIA